MTSEELYSLVQAGKLDLSGNAKCLAQWMERVEFLKLKLKYCRQHEAEAIAEELELWESLIPANTCK